MNRNTLFRFLEESSLEFRWVRTHNKNYRAYYVPDDWEKSSFLFNKNVVTDFHHIYLCNSEMILYDLFGKMRINLKYSDLRYIAIGNETAKLEELTDNEESVTHLFEWK